MTFNLRSYFRDKGRHSTDIAKIHVGGLNSPLLSWIWMILNLITKGCCLPLVQGHISKGIVTHNQNSCVSYIAFTAVFLDAVLLLFSWLVGWLIVLRIYVASAVFQPYHDLEAGDNQSLKIQELNHSATSAPYTALQCNSHFT